MMKIIAMGSALVDIMTMLDSDLALEKLNLPKGSMQLIDAETSKKIQKETKKFKQTIECGGSAANTIRALARLNVKTSYLGKTGEDDLGNFYISNLKECGVCPTIIKSKTPTGVAFAFVSKDSERTFATYLGAASELKPEDIMDSIFDGFDILHIEGYLVFNHDLIRKAIVTAKNKGLKISLDMASYNVVADNLEFLKDLIKNYVDIVFANEEEAKAFTGEQPKEALYTISEFCDIAVVKVGEHGSYVKNGDYIHHEKSLKINPVDSTGAGDYFAAGFLYGIVRGFSLDKCAKIGTILAGNVMEFVGPILDEDRWTLINNEKKMSW